jgi:hypothetical protein
MEFAHATDGFSAGEIAYKVEHHAVAKKNRSYAESAFRAA